jgi:hypothetical protein
MRAITTYDEEATGQLNQLTATALKNKCEKENMKLTIENGTITQATIIHRDYVHVTDGRINYIK